MISVGSISERKSLNPEPILSVARSDGGFDCYFVGDELPQPVRTLVTAKAEKIAAIGAYAANLRQTIRASVNPWATPEEMATWPIKRAEAEAYQASQNPADAPTLAIEAQVRNIALADIVTRVLTNAAVLLEAEITIAGTSGLHRDAVAALATIAEVDAYDYSAGWPV
jgi:hypothetical protein